MNERTAEEKLRQTLMGDISEQETNKKNLKAPRKTAKKIQKSKSAEKVINSFMEDFEKKI